jgi:TonB family protein
MLMTFVALRALEKMPVRAERRDVALAAPSGSRVYLPSPAEMKRMLAPPVPAAPRVRTPPPTPPPPAQKDRMSIGGPDSRRPKELWLREDQPITKTAGEGDGRDAGAPKEAMAEATAAPAATAEEPAKSDALQFPAGRGEIAPPSSGAGAPSITGSLRRLEQKWARGAGPGSGNTTLGDFDPLGADFTEWINHFTREVYRNWITPQAAMMGFHGKVRIQFTVARDGSLLRADVVESSGTVSLDRAARHAMLGSRFLPLPADYGAETLTTDVSFYYNVRPQPS